MQRRQTVTVPSRRPQAALGNRRGYKGRVADPSALSSCLNSRLPVFQSSREEEDMADARMFTEEDYGYPDRP